MRSNRIFYMFFFALSVLLFIPNLLKKGMFVDGLWYAAISRNLANGVGSFWSPYFTQTMFPAFNEHPPLVFGIQSIFFKMFGNSMYVEKLYALFIIILTLMLIQILWNVVFKDRPKLKYFGFLPIILWLLSETTYLFYPNNVLECTQGIFVLISMILMLKGIQSKNDLSFFYLFLAGLSLILSFLSKGLTGLYPLMAILIYYMIYKNIPFKKMITYNIVLFGSFSLIILFYYLNENLADNINNYLNTQLIPALTEERTENMRSSRLYVLKSVIETSILPLSLVIILTLVSYFRYGTRKIFEYKKEILFFTVLGLTGVLPMIISKKQASYYYLTVIPYFSIALGLILLSNKLIFNKLRSSRPFKVITYLLLAFSFIYPVFSINKLNKRDEVLLNDMELFESKLENMTTIGCITKKKEISLYGYFMRIHSISLDTIAPYDHSLLICDIKYPIDSTEFRPIVLKTEKFSLYEKIDQ